MPKASEIEKIIEFSKVKLIRLITYIKENDFIPLLEKIQALSKLKDLLSEIPPLDIKTFQSPLLKAVQNTALYRILNKEFFLENIEKIDKDTKLLLSMDSFKSTYDYVTRNVIEYSLLGSWLYWTKRKLPSKEAQEIILKTDNFLKELTLVALEISHEQEELSKYVQDDFDIVINKEQDGGKKAHIEDASALISKILALNIFLEDSAKKISQGTAIEIIKLVAEMIRQPDSNSPLFSKKNESRSHSLVALFVKGKENYIDIFVKPALRVKNENDFKRIGIGIFKVIKPDGFHIRFTEQGQFLKAQPIVTWSRSALAQASLQNQNSPVPISPEAKKRAFKDISSDDGRKGELGDFEKVSFQSDKRFFYWQKSAGIGIDKVRKRDPVKIKRMTPKQKGYAIFSYLVNLYKIVNEEQIYPNDLKEPNTALLYVSQSDTYVLNLIDYKDIGTTGTYYIANSGQFSNYFNFFTAGQLDELDTNPKFMGFLNSPKNAGSNAKHGKSVLKQQLAFQIVYFFFQFINDGERLTEAGSKFPASKAEFIGKYSTYSREKPFFELVADVAYAYLDIQPLKDQNGKFKEFFDFSKFLMKAKEECVKRFGETSVPIEFNEKFCHNLNKSIDYVMLLINQKKNKINQKKVRL